MTEKWDYVYAVQLFDCDVCDSTDWATTDAAGFKDEINDIYICVNCLPATRDQPGCALPEWWVYRMIGMFIKELREASKRRSNEIDALETRISELESEMRGLKGD